MYMVPVKGLLERGPSLAGAQCFTHSVYVFPANAAGKRPNDVSRSLPKWRRGK